MPIFKQRKYAGGGGIQKTFNNPGFGLGLEYIPTAQELPDLEGLMYVEQAKEKARAQLDALKKEITPDVSALLKPLDELEMFGSIKNDFSRDVRSKVAAFKAKMSADPDFAFSMEARNEYSDLMSSLNSNDYQYQALRYKELRADYDEALKKGLGETFYISNGQMPLVNLKTGEIEMKDIETAKELLMSGEENYARFNKSSQIWDYYHKYARKDFNDFVPFSGRSTVKDARTEIDEKFKSVASSISEQISFDDVADKSGVAVYQLLKEKVGSNANQLTAAVQQVINTLSQASQDALRGDYIQRTNDFSEDGFLNYVKSYLNGEASIRHENNSTVDLSTSVLSKDLQGSQKGVDGNLGVPIETAAGFNLRDSNILWDWGGKDTFNSPIVAKSSLAGNPYDVQAQKTLMGKQLVYSGEYGSSGAKGQLSNQNTTLYGVTDRGFYLMPVSTGQVVSFRDGKYSIETDEETIPANRMLNSTEDHNVNLPGRLKIKSQEKKIINIGGIDYLTYPSTEEGKWIVATPRAFAMHHGFTDKELKSKSETVVFRALDPSESIQAFSSPNFAVDYKSTDFFDEKTNKVSTDGKNHMDNLISTMDVQIGQLEQGIAGSTSSVATQKNQQMLEVIESQKKELDYIFKYIKGVESGTVILKTDSDREEYDQLRFKVNMILNEMSRNNQISNVQQLTTAINNSFKATTKFNNIVR